MKRHNAKLADTTQPPRPEPSRRVFFFIPTTERKSTMTTKNELIAAIANRIVEKKSTVEHVFNSALAEIERSLLEGKPVTLNGFGTFEVKKRAARTGRNPRTGEPVEIAASTTVAFKPAKALKDSLN